MDRGVWGAIVHGVSKNWTQLSTHTYTSVYIPSHLFFILSASYTSIQSPSSSHASFPLLCPHVHSVGRSASFKQGSQRRSPRERYIFARILSHTENIRQRTQQVQRVLSMSMTDFLKGEQEGSMAGPNTKNEVRGMTQNQAAQGLIDYHTVSSSFLVWIFVNIFFLSFCIVLDNQQNVEEEQ